MITDQRTLQKLPEILKRYDKQRYECLATVPMRMTETLDNFRREPVHLIWHNAVSGIKWGGDAVNAWFAGDYTVPEKVDGCKIFIRALTGGNETLFFVNNQPAGVFDHHHHEVLLTGNGNRQIYRLAFEAYAGHVVPGCGIPEDEGMPATTDSPLFIKYFQSIEVLLERVDVSAFFFDLNTLLQLINILDEHSLRRGKIIAGLAKVFATIDANPAENAEANWRPKLIIARQIMAPLLSAHNGSTAPLYGLVGHSHLDTAWLWPLTETWRKFARTFSSVLNIMEQFPEMTFIQSAPYHIDVVKREYPELYVRIKEQVEAGRWEPNGAMWVEPDCNIPSGESLVRQLLHGQRTTRELFGYTSDTLWLPDVFGYSAALPQLLQGCGVKYFVTSKIGWNDSTRFPYDTFNWKGIDGTSVLAHFNFIHNVIEPKLFHDTWQFVQHTDIQDRRLCAYGFGDGGGGPVSDDLEMSRRMADLEGIPRSQHTTVSSFMQNMQDEMTDLPAWTGELYLEGHRGTLTSVARLKNANRRAEFAMRDAEYLSVLATLNGATYPATALDNIWKRLLVRQFHDILPGTSIASVNDEATAVFNNVISEAKDITDAAINALGGGNGDRILIINSLSWDRNNVVLENIPAGMFPISYPSQRITDVSGNEKLLIGGITLPALGAVSVMLNTNNTNNISSPFLIDEKGVSTPFIKMCWDTDGRIISVIDNNSGRELIAVNGHFNAFVIGEDIPLAWDNWDIDRDQRLKRNADLRLISREVATDGPLQLRIRSRYHLGQKSFVTQDMVFHADNAQIDFDTRVDWHEIHQLFKTCFNLDILADFARHEIQYGHAERPTHENLPQDRARFEVCAHKWTDLSENGFGIALLNDSKYGISVQGNQLGLSLIKSGTRPDIRADEGVHCFTYSILPHSGGFSVKSVVRPAYELNVTPLVCNSSLTGFPGLLSVDSPNVIVESIKWAEDGNAFIVRIYEAGKTGAYTTITFNHPVSYVEEANLLEEPQRIIPVVNNSVSIYIRPFQVFTLRYTI